MSETYVFTLELDVLDGPRLIEYARNKAHFDDALSEDEAEKMIPDVATALQWIFDDNRQLQEAGYPAEIVCSSCELVAVNERPSNADMNAIAPEYAEFHPTNETATTYQVAVWWPKDRAYGLPTDAKSMRAALAEAARHETLGYANGGGEIHIIKTVRSVHVYGR